jgi:thioredoxin 1
MAQVHTFTTDNFASQVLAPGQVVLVDFWAPWCGPCRMVAPVLEEIAAEFEGRLKVGKVNVDEHRGLATKFAVMSIPTLVVIRDGQEVDRIVGFSGKKSLVDQLERILKQ